MKEIEEVRGCLTKLEYPTEQMKAIEEIIMIIGDYKHQIEQLQKENEYLKQEKEALRLGYNEVMGETLLENIKLKERIEELRKRVKELEAEAYIYIND